MLRPTWLSVLVALASMPTVVAGQRTWNGNAELAASLLQGNTNQRSLITRGELTHADSAWEVRSSASFGYADATRDTLPRQVERRTWLTALAVDYRPLGVVSPFAFLNYETSYEKRVRDRVGLGVGGKLVVFRTSATTANVSLAVLAERMRPTRLSPDTTTLSTTRWSGRFRLRHRLDSLLSISQTTFYQPRLTQASSYTVNSISELNYTVHKALMLTLSYQALFDSDARNRGARSNNDAQLLLGLKTAF